MATEVKLPKLGEGIESGDVLEVFVQEGDTVKKDQTICELETEKATVPVPSSHSGKVTKVHIKSGQSIPIGATLLTIEAAAGAESAPAKAPAKPAAQAAKPAATQAAKPAAAPAKAAPAKTADPDPDEVATPATAPSKPAPPASKPAPQPAAARSAPAAKPEPRQPEPRQPEPAQPAATATAAPGGAIAAGPAVRRFAREVGVDLAKVPGTGDGGRITRDDVLEVVRKINRTVQDAPAQKRPAHQTSTTVTPPGEPGSDNWGAVRFERLTKIRKTIAARMTESWTTIPKVTNFDDADITELERIRKDNKEDYSAAGIKLTTMPFVIKAVALALRAHPAINASLDLANEQIVYKEYVNIGIAVDSERGLVVPSLRNADQLSIPEIARSLADLAEKVRKNDFTLDDLRGSTFTISNLGAIGGTYSTPIINPPEVAILLTGRARKLPVVMEDDHVEPRLMLPLSLSYDHRLIDGAIAARFLNDLIKYLRAPSRLLMAP